jgi:hypothetical protein
MISIVKYYDSRSHKPHPLKTAEAERPLSEPIAKAEFSKGTKTETECGAAYFDDHFSKHGFSERLGAHGHTLSAGRSCDQEI